MSAIPGEAPNPSRELLPSGTVTFAFTDIEGSALRWERDRAAMQDAVRRHDALLRAAMVECGGHVFKTIGDAFCASFRRPEDAVAAMLAAQRALANEDFSAIGELRVRAAVHTGTADERDGDYFGPAVNRVARLLAIGHGGQVLLSGVTRDLVHGSLPPQAGLLDLGEHRLKDLARPEHVYQLIAPDLGTEFAPLRSLSHPSNLPLQLTSFVGRDVEIAEIATLLAAHRLVTLTGSGGIGKTRTSLQVAATLLDGFDDGVWLVELAPLASGEYIASTVAQALGLTLSSEDDPVDGLVRVLKTKNALLVFDNCEHLIEPVARVISALLHGCSKVSILASSRQALSIAGEETYRLPSLDIASAAVALFVERGRATDKRFTLTDENAATIADICRRLDGIPLAIELAATRIKILSPRQLRERLDERFRVLTGGSRDVLPRQQTLRAMIDWSYGLLDEHERVLFRRLGIFVNGFTLEGAVAVGTGEELDEDSMLDVLTSLVDKSLVLAEPAADSARYRLLESTRAYATEKLSEAGERDLLEARHLKYLRDRFADYTEHMQRTARETERTEAFATDLEDIRAALERSSRSNALGGAALLAEIGDSWSILGSGGEGIARNQVALESLPRDETLLLARLSITLSELLSIASQKTRSAEAAIAAVAYARASGDGPALGFALSALSWVSLGLHKPDEAEKALAEAEAIPGRSTWLRVRHLRCRAFLAAVINDAETGARILEELRKEHRSLGNTNAEHRSALNLAEVEHGRGQTQRAIALARETVEARRGMQMNLDVNIRANLVGYLTATDDLAGAAEVAREALAVYGTREPDRGQIAYTIEHLALVLALRGNHARAAVLEGYTDAALKRYGTEREFTEITSKHRLTTLLRDNLGAGDLARMLAEGAALTPEAAVALALEKQ